MKKLKKLRLVVEVECGSAFQQEFINTFLDVLPKSIKTFCESKHRDNKVTYKITQIK